MDADIDMDIDLGGEHEEGEIEGDMIDHSTSAPVEDTTVEGDAITSTGVTSEPIAEKIHIRGVDSLTTADVRMFATHYYPQHEPSKVEWVDDTAANLVYASSDHATAALTALSDPFEADIAPSVLHLRKAKKHPTLSDIFLRVRQATVSDMKKATSRTLPPRLGNHIVARHNPSSRRHMPQRNEYEDLDRSHKRQRDEEVQFHDDMYDDAPTTGRGGDLFLMHGPRNKRVRFGNNDLFAAKLHGLSEPVARSVRRDRSASPSSALHDGDGRFGFDANNEVATNRNQLRRRGDTPPHLRENRNAGLELFATRGTELNTSRELFPNSLNSTSRSTKELFPGRGSVTPNHRRSDAIDAGDGTSPLSAGRSRNSRLFNEDATSHLQSESTESSLEKRITGFGRLEDRITGGPGPALPISGRRNDGGHRGNRRGSDSRELFPDRRDMERSQGSRDLFDRVGPGSKGQMRT